MSVGALAGVLGPGAFVGHRFERHAAAFGLVLGSTFLCRPGFKHHTSALITYSIAIDVTISINIPAARVLTGAASAIIIIRAINVSMTALAPVQCNGAHADTRVCAKKYHPHEAGLLGPPASPRGSEPEGARGSKLIIF